MLMNVAFVTSRLSSAAGGLSVSVPNLAHALSRSGREEIHVFGTFDPHRREEAWIWAPHVHAHAVLGPAALQYAPGLMKDLRRLDPGLIDVQGLWTYPSLVSLRHHRRTGSPYVVTPRGMLDPWALRNSAWKKRLAWSAFEGAHLREARLACDSRDGGGAFQKGGPAQPNRDRAER